jgi:hypothetical protein
MPHAPCPRCSQLVRAARAGAGGALCDLCDALGARDDARRRVKLAIGAAVAATCATALLVVAGHAAAAGSLGVGLAVTGALWVSALPRVRVAAWRGTQPGR